MTSSTSTTHSSQSSSLLVQTRNNGFGAVLVALIFVVLMLVGSTSTAGPPPATLQSAAANSAAPATEQSRPTDRPRPTEQPRKSYLGRIVAQPMSHLGAAWLIRTNRDDEENVTDSYKQLKLTAGMTVCDMGCGNGYWSLPMARDVGPEGRVLASEMLDKLRMRAGKLKLDNIEPVLGDLDDPNLPERQVDLLLMVDVYHEFSHPESMLWGIRRSLVPEGVVALLEYREEDPEVPIKRLHKMSKTQIMKEYQQNGFKLVREYNKLPWQHLMFFARDDSPLEEIEPLPAKEVLDQLKHLETKASR